MTIRQIIRSNLMGMSNARLLPFIQQLSSRQKFIVSPFMSNKKYFINNLINNYKGLNEIQFPEIENTNSSV